MDILEFSFSYFLEQIFLIARPERIIALQHDVVQNAQGPHVSIDGNVVNFGHDLGSHISRSTTECVYCVWRYRMNTKSKIN